MVRVADSREYLLHDIKLYKKLLEIYAKEDVSSELSAAIRHGDYEQSLARIRSERDKAKLIGAESLVKMTDKLESLCRKKEFELLRERIGAFVSERNALSDAISERL